MTFEHAWVLAFLLLPIGWMLFEWQRTRRTLALALKTLAFVAIVLALAEPKLTLPETKMAVAVLVDTSASVSPQDLSRASELAGALEKARGRHWVRILPFARSVRNLAPGEQARGWHFKYTAGEAGRATDLEAAIGEAVTSLPSGLVPRLVLISDGKRERRQHHARRLASPAPRHSHRYHCARRPAPAQPASGIGESADAGIYRRTVPRRSERILPDSRLGDRRDQRRGKASGIQSCQLWNRAAIRFACMPA